MNEFLGWIQPKNDFYEETKFVSALSRTVFSLTFSVPDSAKLWQRDHEKREVNELRQHLYTLTFEKIDNAHHHHPYY